MTSAPSTLEAATLEAATLGERRDLAARPIATHELTRVTGGGIAGELGSMFGPEGAKWGGFADKLLGMFGVGG